MPQKTLQAVCLESSEILCGRQVRGWVRGGILKPDINGVEAGRFTLKLFYVSHNGYQHLRSQEIEKWASYAIHLAEWLSGIEFRERERERERGIICPQRRTKKDLCNEDSPHPRDTQIWVTAALISCVSLGKLSHLSELQFPSSIIGLPWEFNKTTLGSTWHSESAISLFFPLLIGENEEREASRDTGPHTPRSGTKS